MLNKINMVNIDFKKIFEDFYNQNSENSNQIKGIVEKIFENSKSYSSYKNFILKKADEITQAQGNRLTQEERIKFSEKIDLLHNNKNFAKLVEFGMNLNNYFELLCDQNAKNLAEDIKQKFNILSNDFYMTNPLCIVYILSYFHKLTQQFKNISDNDLKKQEELILKVEALLIEKIINNIPELKKVYKDDVVVDFIEYLVHSLVAKILNFNYALLPPEKNEKTIIIKDTIIGKQKESVVMAHQKLSDIEKKINRSNNINDDDDNENDGLSQLTLYSLGKNLFVDFKDDNIKDLKTRYNELK